MIREPKSVRRRIVAMIAAGMSILATGCNGTSPSRAAAETPGPVPRIVHQAHGPALLEIAPGSVHGMTIAQVRAVQLPGVLETTGQVSFDDRLLSTISARVAGRIEETRVSQWDFVTRGEQIVQLYSPDFMTAEAEYLQARATSRISSSPGLGSGELAASMVLAARRKLELLGMSRGDIDNLDSPNPLVWVRAPVSGTIVENKVVRGSAVNPGDVLFTLGNLQEVWIVGNIFEDEIARVHPGQQLRAITTAYPDDVFVGSVTRVSPGIDPNTHTLQIRCEVKNPNGKLRPQMLARIQILTRPASTLVVPQSSLVFDTRRYYAYVELTPGRFERRAVEIGPWKEEAFARVLSGLKAGERVVENESIQVNALWHEANGESS
jgi:membrane fusion protein, copper/silver efflux system